MSMHWPESTNSILQARPDVPDPSFLCFKNTKNNTPASVFTIANHLSCLEHGKVHIYKKDGGQWVKVQELKEHNGHITGPDWAPKGDRTITCGAHRNTHI